MKDAPFDKFISGKFGFETYTLPWRDLWKKVWDEVINWKVSIREISNFLYQEEGKENLNDDDKEAKKANSWIFHNDWDFKYTLSSDMVKEKERITKILSKKFTLSSSINKEDDFRKWNRINRWYILGNSYKPLRKSVVSEAKKKKLMVIVDGSGSMTSRSSFTVGWKEARNYEVASIFAHALRDCDVFDIKKILFHESEGFIDI